MRLLAHFAVIYQAVGCRLCPGLLLLQCALVAQLLMVGIQKSELTALFLALQAR